MGLTRAGASSNNEMSAVLAAADIQAKAANAKIFSIKEGRVYIGNTVSEMPGKEVPFNEQDGVVEVNINNYWIQL